MMKRYTQTVQILVLALLMIFLNQLLVSPTRLPCPKNMHRGCRKTCRENCDALKETGHQECSEDCIVECVCKPDYIYKSNTSKECVPKADCNVTCPKNMHYDHCTNGLQATCESPKRVPILPQYCSPWCVCDEGYIYRSHRNQTCVLNSECQV